MTYVPKPRINLIILILVLMSSIGCNSLNQEEDTSNNPMKHPFQALLDSIYLAHPDSRGIAMHVHAPYHDIQWEGAVGYADSATGRQLKSQDPALLASITKMYMAAATLRCVELKQFTLETPIAEVLWSATNKALIKAGYATDSIKIKHLLSCTSGLYDYVETSIFQERASKDPGYVWTRQEQVELALEQGKPYGKPGESYHHSDMNFLILGLILEQTNNQMLRTLVREKLQFAKHGLDQTWWNLQEKKPYGLSDLVHQFAAGYAVDSYSQHGSFDNFGGGGIAATVGDLARFTQLLFEGDLFRDSSTTSLLLEQVTTADGQPYDYRMGIMAWEKNGITHYGHGGFWGTMTQYLPEHRASVAVFTLERDKWKLNLELIDQVNDYLNTLDTQ